MFVFALLVAVCLATPVKNLAGPPSEFDTHRIPEPVAISARSASLNLWFTPQSASDLLSSTPFPVDGQNEFVLSFASPLAAHLRVELLGPDGKPVDGKKIISEKGDFEIDDNSANNIPTTSFFVMEAQNGFYTFNVYAHGLKTADLEAVRNNPRPDGVLTFINDDNVQIHSKLQSYEFPLGSEIGLVASVGDATNFIRSDISVNSAIMEVTTPDGTTFDIKMKDDGESGDFLANDQIYGAKIKAAQPGTYILHANMGGNINAGDSPFQRTSQHLIKVSASPIRLSGEAHITQKDAGHLLVSLGVSSGFTRSANIRAYAEVWGTDASKKLAPACWIGGIIESTQDGSADLVLDIQWLQKAGVSLPLVLKNVYIADLDTSFPIDSIEKESFIKVAQIGQIRVPFRAASSIQITDEMLFGVNPLPPVNASAVKSSHDLLLLPGYCADVNPWTRDASKFTGGFFPLDFGNHANDAYAKKILAQVEKNGMGSYGIIGHSQGGMVGLHIHNYYWSGTSQAKGNRLLQSVGTPYQGSTAAGSAANLGSIFGIGCGSNVDLSRDGAVNWLAGISAASRKSVHYYTTTYQQGNFFGDWCSFPMNLVLQWPNDGVVELSYAQLSGAMNMGNKEKSCHTTDMTYTPQYDDSTRNAEMNKNAAR